MSHVADDAWMQRALELAEQGRGHVEPNPLVGAVVVRNGQVVGEGWHQTFGGPHAEVFALAAAGEAARGATLYVTLEPCCHFGKTPPCTTVVIQSGIGRVVAAMRDPFPKVAGGGFKLLREAGIDISEGLCEAAASRLNAPYLTLLSQNRPHVHAKWAMTLDGKIATRTGQSQWISNESSRAVVHQMRGRMDGVLIGIGTALADDPQLTARPAGPRLATRIVLDSQAQLPPTSKLAVSARHVPTLVVTSEGSDDSRRRRLLEQGCEVLVLPSVDGRPALPLLLSELGRRRFTNLLVEGGSAVLGSLLDAGLIDEVHVFLSPRLIGGQTAPSPIGGLGTATLAEALQFSGRQTSMLDGDLYIHGWR